MDTEPATGDPALPLRALVLSTYGVGCLHFKSLHLWKILLPLLSTELRGGDLPLSSVSKEQSQESNSGLQSVHPSTYTTIPSSFLTSAPETSKPSVKLCPQGGPG